MSKISKIKIGWNWGDKIKSVYLKFNQMIIKLQKLMRLWV